ncbi:hypothetical protein STCU_11613 [Strigomonas culicis]|uniref:Uncharacterized protein n=1 Tax=Strigomonas culicis TaxID=28005 RepID=S9TDB7_9TRYP|nr:hypothetical protein STCU_11613 [Strigomonas culicis]|eukprot:EPY16007.1 hypothetical protein STCU_11613 [Strigomonas culicis]
MSSDDIHCSVHTAHRLMPFMFAAAAEAPTTGSAGASALLTAERERILNISYDRHLQWLASMKDASSQETTVAATNDSVLCHGASVSVTDSGGLWCDSSSGVSASANGSGTTDGSSVTVAQTAFLNWSRPTVLGDATRVLEFCNSETARLTYDAAILKRICAGAAAAQEAAARATAAAAPLGTLDRSDGDTASGLQQDLLGASTRAGLFEPTEEPEGNREPPILAAKFSGGAAEADDDVIASVNAVEPSGYIGFGALLSPLVLIGLYKERVYAVYVDGMRTHYANFISNYSIELPTVPEYPDPPLDMLECRRTFVNRDSRYGVSDLDGVVNQSSAFIAPVTVSIFTVVNSNFTDSLPDGSVSTVMEGEGTLRNTTIVLDGQGGRPLLARHSSYTTFLLGVPGNTHVMSNDDAYYTIKTLNANASKVKRGAAGTSSLTDPSSFSLYDRLTAARSLYNVTSQLPHTRGIYYTASGYDRRNASTMPGKVASGPSSLLLSSKRAANRTLSHHLAQREELAAVVQRYSARIGMLTYSPTTVVSSMQPNTSIEDYILTEAEEMAAVHKGLLLGRDETFLLQCRASMMEDVVGNGTVLFSTGEITGDPTTATITTSLYHPMDSYHLFVVMPYLQKVSMFAGLPAFYGFDDWGVRLIDSATLYAVEQHVLHVTGTVMRTTMPGTNRPWDVKLHRVAMPTLLPVADYPYVVDLYDAAAAGTVLDQSADGISFGVDLYATANNGTNDNFNGNFAIDPMESCGSGTVVYVFLRTAPTANTGPISDAGAAAAELLMPFPVTINSHSNYRFRALCNSYPQLGQQLSARQAQREEAEAAGLTVVGDVQVVFHYLFVSRNYYSRVYRVHCYGDGDVDVALRSSDNATVLVEHVCQVNSSYTPSASAPINGSSYVDMVSDLTFTSESDMVFNVTCTHRLEDVVAYLAEFVDGSGDSGSMRAMGVFCGISLEVVSLRVLFLRYKLPVYSVVEMRAPIADGSRTVSLTEEDGPEGIRLSGDLQDVILSCNRSSATSSGPGETAALEEEVLAVVGSIPTRAACRSSAYARFAKVGANVTANASLSDDDGATRCER